MDIGNQIRERRRRLGISQDELARRLYVSRVTVSHWETSKTLPDVQSMLLLANLFGTTIDELVRGDVDEMRQMVERDERRTKIFAVALAAVLLAALGLGASGTGVTGIFGLLLCLQHPLEYIIMAAISIGVAFALTWLFGYKDAEPEKNTAEPAPQAEVPEKTSVQCQPGTVYAPVSGNVVPSEQIPDETFAAGILGRGVGIEPSEGVVVAPFDGEISSVTDTHHAVGVTSPDGMELLIHVGVDTVDMKGDGFQCFVKAGQKVKAGEKLIAFDREKIAAAGHPDMVAVLLTNADDYKDLKIETGSRKALDKILQV